MLDITITDLRVNKGDSAFLIDNGKTTIMYDSGFAFTGGEVAKKIKMVLKNRDLDYIFLTHSHYDHALGSCYALKVYPNAKVVAGEYATKIFSKDSAKALMRDLDKKFALKCGVSEYEDLIDNLRVDMPVKDGDEIIAGDMTFRVINLPGHTKCSVGYYCEKYKLLLSCETVGVFNGDKDVLPSYLVGYQMAIDSIDKLNGFEIENILVPHYGVLTGKMAKFYINKGRENAVDVANKFKAMLEEGCDKSQILRYFKDRFYHGYVKEIYPIDAMELNTNITINLIERELLGR